MNKDNHTDKIKYYESMGYVMVEDHTAANKTLMGRIVPGYGAAYVTIKNGVPKMGKHM